MFQLLFLFLVKINVFYSATIIFDNFKVFVIHHFCVCIVEYRAGTAVPYVSNICFVFAPTELVVIYGNP